MLVVRVSRGHGGKGGPGAIAGAIVGRGAGWPVVRGGGS